MKPQPAKAKEWDVWTATKWPCGAKVIEPLGYIDRQEWTEQKSLTHEQLQCEKCERWHIWKPKTPNPEPKEPKP